MDSGLLDSIRKSALLAVVEPNYTAWLRGICRWFSIKFNTPLHVVEEFDTVYLLQHYFEHIYSEMDEDNKNEQRRSLLETQEERMARITKQELEDDDFYKEAQKELAESVTLEKVTAQSKQLKSQSLKFKESIPEYPQKPLTEEPEIKINFVDESVLEEEFDYDPIPSK